MPHIRVIAAVAATIVAFWMTPASARPCADADTGCSTKPAQPEAAKLDDFMTTWKPVTASKRVSHSKRASVSKRVKKSRSARKRAGQETVSRQQPAQSEAVAEIAPQAETVAALTTAPEASNDTDGVAVNVASAGTELNLAPDEPVQVVAFNDVNELDLAAPSPPAPAETVGQSTAPQAPADNSWIAKLLLAVAGTIAAAGATRLLVA
jgi:hypothetical protein